MIGSGPQADLKLSGSEIAPRHAEWIGLEPSGPEETGARPAGHLTSCGGDAGCWRLVDGQWQPVRQAFVGAADELRFGRQVADALQISVRELIQRARAAEDAARNRSDLSGAVERDPETGLLVRRLD